MDDVLFLELLRSSRTLGLIRPEILLSILGFSVLDHSLGPPVITPRFYDRFIHGFIRIGVYYVLAALNNMKQFYAWTVPFRCITFVVFTAAALTDAAPTRFIGVGAWELSGAIATGIALWRR